MKDETAPNCAPRIVEDLADIKRVDIVGNAKTVMALDEPNDVSPMT